MYHLKGSPADPNRIYASQTSGWFGQLVQRSDDGGATWRTQAEGLPSPTFTNVLRDAAGTDQDPDEPGLYVGTRNGEVYASTDGGESFALLATQLPDVYCVRALTLA
jgi:photosystem II stability/assembly factor-like uncharacterized protein